VFEDLMGMPLHPSKPLWQMHLVEHYGQGSALILRLEHAVADGDAMMHILDVISDPDPSRPWSEPAPAPPRSMFLGTVEALFGLGDRALSLPAEIFHRARSPRRLAREGVRVARAFGKVVFCLPDPQTILRGKRSTAHRLAVSEPIPLSEVKAIGKPLGATVNDVILSAVAGGLRRYMRIRGQGVDDFSIRGIVPVSLRTRAEAANLGNGFGLVFLSLPIDIGDPEERLRELKGRMDEIKQSPEAQVSYAILHLFGVLPRSTQNLGVRFFTTKVTATMTNVAGPRETRYLASSRIDRILFSVPHPGDIAIGMSIMSYDGTVLVTLDTDAQLIPNPEDIIIGFQADLEVLRRRAVEVGRRTAEAASDGQQPAPAKV
jgi:WS/DGAT/MGAT family acyltransferase